MIKKTKEMMLIIFIIFLSAIASAKEVVYLGRSPRGLLMGDAFTAIADDEYSMLYNPASLGRNNGVIISPINPNFALTNVYSDLSKFKNFPTGNNAAVGITNRLMDYPLYLNYSFLPTIKMAQFGFSLIANSETSLTFRNAIHPVMDINYRYDRGFIMGGAINILGTGAYNYNLRRSGKIKISTGERLAIGFSVKHLTREGIDSSYDVFGTKLLGTLSSGANSVTSILNALGYAKGSGWGGDLGVEFVKSERNSTFVAGYSLLDIGGTYFKKTEGVGSVPQIPMTQNLGVSYKYDLGVIDYTVSADLHPFFSQVDFSRQLHFGAELSMPFISLLGGFSEGYFSYGAAIKLWPMKLITGFYSVENGAYYKEKEAKRFLLFLSLFDVNVSL